MKDTELGEAFLDAFGDAADARMELNRTMDTPGFYDPVGDIEKDLRDKYNQSLVKLVESIRAIQAPKKD